jgi:hypothetical protein
MGRRIDKAQRTHFFAHYEAIEVPTERRKCEPGLDRWFDVPAILPPPQLKFDIPEQNNDDQAEVAGFLRKLKDDFGLSAPQMNMIAPGRALATCSMKDYILGPDEVLLMSEYSPRSFDARYFARFRKRPSNRSLYR